jgi:cob(I)alamin adenosyltransferase
MLYTRKGDDGTTKTWGCNQRVSKSSLIAEALGSLDEVNSFLGLAKVRATETRYSIDALKAGKYGERYKGPTKVEHIVHWIQDTLFTVQAQVAGFPKEIPAGRIGEVEHITDTIEKELPPITSFFISGGTELAATFDVARTLARRAERRVVAVSEQASESPMEGAMPGAVKISPDTLQFLNRLSSLLYALARYTNFRAGVSESPPKYE